MALSPIISGGANLASSGGYGASPVTPELRAEANGSSRPATRQTLADSSQRIISDPVTLSDQARQASATRASEPANTPGAAKSASSGEELTESEQKQVAELKKRDREVRQHEQAHQAAGGQYARAPTYEYKTGPDGKRYAVGGEVQIDANPIPGDPEATIEKMRVVKAAALAPAEPSGQDRKVAASADAAAQAARAELAAQKREDRQAALEGDNAEESTQPGQPQPANDATGQPDAIAERGQTNALGFSGAEPASAVINQANGAYTATTRAQAIRQTSAIFA